MTRHFNPSISENAARILNSKGGDYISDEVSNILMPVIMIDSPIRISRSATSNSTIFTTPAEEDFYLTNGAISGSKAVGDSGTQILLTGIIDGVTQNLLIISGITLTAERDSLSMQFERPGIKLDRNTAIILTTTGTWTNKAATIQGYVVAVKKS